MYKYMPLCVYMFVGLWFGSLIVDLAEGKPHNSRWPRRNWRTPRWWMLKNVPTITRVKQQKPRTHIHTHTITSNSIHKQTASDSRHILWRKQQKRIAMLLYGRHARLSMAIEMRSTCARFFGMCVCVFFVCARYVTCVTLGSRMVFGTHRCACNTRRGLVLVVSKLADTVSLHRV